REVRRLLSYLPQNCEELPPEYPAPLEASEPDLELDRLVPDNPNKPYDMHDVLRRVFDPDSFMEVHRAYAQNLVVGFARLAGRTVGIVGNQPNVLAGVLDINASVKGAR